MLITNMDPKTAIKAALVCSKKAIIKKVNALVKYKLLDAKNTLLPVIGGIGNIENNAIHKLIAIAFSINKLFGRNANAFSIMAKIKFVNGPKKVTHPKSLYLIFPLNNPTLRLAI